MCNIGYGLWFYVYIEFLAPAKLFLYLLCLACLIVSCSKHIYKYEINAGIGKLFEQKLYLLRLIYNCQFHLLCLCI
jgi:hypothetical protein